MNATENLLYERLVARASEFHKVIDFDPAKDKIVKFNLTSQNDELSGLDPADTNSFTEYINVLLKKNKAKFGIGGYKEVRDLYSRSDLFSYKSDSVKESRGSVAAVLDKKQEEPRRFHLGVDIWGEAGSKVYAPLGGRVHSYAFNNNFGDYGATIILMHQLDGFPFYTLYGHISLADLAKVKEGDYIIRGMEFAHFGTPEENGFWPPHLHFQIIDEIHYYKGDYPGVCKSSEQKNWLANSPDPDAILQLMKYV